MVNIVGILGAIFGAAGLAVALYSQYKQRRFEEQLERKEELREMAQRLEIIHESGEQLLNLMNDPRSHEDLDMALFQLSRDALAYNHSEGELPTVRFNGFAERRENSREYINHDAETVLDKWKTTAESGGLKNRPIADFELITDEPEVTVTSSYYLAQFHSDAYLLYSFLEEFDEEHAELLTQFKPDVLDNLRDTLDDIFTESVAHMENVGTITIDPEDYENADEIGNDLYSRFFHYEGIDEDLTQLREVLEDVEDVREKAIQTSYS